MPPSLAVFNNKVAMAYVGHAPWHGSGQEVDEIYAYDLEHFMKESGLDSEVVTFDLYTELPNGRSKIKTAKAFFRRDQDGNYNELAVVGPRTTPLQNRNAFEFFKPFLETKSAALHTAGALDEGRRVWVLAKLALPNSKICNGDEIEKHVMLSNSHDGTLAVRVGFTPIRIVCANTLAMAHSSKASKLIRIRHSKHVSKNVEAVRDIMDLTNQEFDATDQQYQALANKGINQSDLNKYIKKTMKMKEKDELATRTENIFNDILNKFERNMFAKQEEKELVDKMIESQHRADTAALDMILENMENGRGVSEVPAARGTWWQAYNAVNEYLNHEKGRTVDTRLNSLWFGESARLNMDALNNALEMSGVSK